MDEEFKVDVEFAICEEGPHFPRLSPLWIPRDMLPRFVAHESWNFRLMTEVLLPAIVQSADILGANERTRRRDSSREYETLYHFHPTSNRDCGRNLKMPIFILTKNNRQSEGLITSREDSDSVMAWFCCSRYV